jgi:hypothetical protein
MLSCGNYKKKAIEVGGVSVIWITNIDIRMKKSTQLDLRHIVRIDEDYSRLANLRLSTEKTEHFELSCKYRQQSIRLEQIMRKTAFRITRKRDGVFLTEETSNGDKCTRVARHEKRGIFLKEFGRGRTEWKFFRKSGSWPLGCVGAALVESSCAGRRVRRGRLKLANRAGCSLDSALALASRILSPAD